MGSNGDRLPRDASIILQPLGRGLDRSLDYGAYISHITQLSELRKMGIGRGGYPLKSRI